jgi:hypothetical protein
VAPHHASRQPFTFVFTAGAFSSFLILTGLIGWRPPGHINLVEAPWRQGVWTGEVLWGQATLGVGLLALAIFVGVRVNRDLSRSHSSRN